ncbi:MAG: hypothetical protein KDD44_15390, partial [Bdellovibrionales bacterium]|nr:hypothetical protein [Bdellovibrionales bacterium]
MQYPLDYVTEESRQRDKARARAVLANRPLAVDKFRVCNVSFLNSAPFRALRQTDWLHYEESSPAECARRLHEREADLAFIPIVEFAMHGGYAALPFGIVGRGPVDSVLLLSDLPLEELRTVYVDAASQTSAMLARLMLKAEGQDHVFFARTAGEALLDAARESRVPSGVVVIGDRSRELRSAFRHATDLSQWWWERHQLPFVFAVWAYRPGAISELQRDELIAAMGDAVENGIIYGRQWADEFGLEREVAEQYLRHRISFPLTSEACHGADIFLREAREQGLLP